VEGGREEGRKGGREEGREGRRGGPAWAAPPEDVLEEELLKEKDLLSGIENFPREGKVAQGI
jgi:hypothetical protein